MPTPIDRFSADYAARVTSYDLFQGDFGDGSERTIIDVVRQAKRRGRCRECLGPIIKGEITRVVKMADSEGLYGGRCCQGCCDAMNKVGGGEDGGADAMEARYALRGASSQ